MCGTLETVTVEPLTNDHQSEVLNFLSFRPIHTVCMAGYIQDHGIVSPLNRGVFYGCRNRQGGLEGVALIGHATLFETKSDEALRAFAQLKHQHAAAHLVRGEHELVERFWKHYAALGHCPRLACQENLWELTEPQTAPGQIPNLRLATIDDLTAITRINAEMIFNECGVNPLRTDPIGFRNRLARRVEQGRVYVWRQRNRLMFKADIFAQTPEVVYLEGVNVHTLERGKGHGLRCMARLGTLLLKRSRSICLLVNKQKEELSHFYSRAGYVVRGLYDTIYLDAPAN